MFRKSRGFLVGWSILLISTSVGSVLFVRASSNPLMTAAIMIFGLSLIALTITMKIVINHSELQEKLDNQERLELMVHDSNVNHESHSW